MLPDCGPAPDRVPGKSLTAKPHLTHGQRTTSSSHLLQPSIVRSSRKSGRRTNNTEIRSITMDGFNGPPRSYRPSPPPPPPVQSQHDFNAGELTSQFEQLLRTRRLNNLSSRPRSRSTSREPHTRSSSNRAPSSHRPSSQHPDSKHHYSSRPPSQDLTPGAHTPTHTYTSVRNLPKVATPPQDPGSLQFRNRLITLSAVPTKYENPGLLDQALEKIPLERIYQEAEDESSLLQAQAASLGGNAKPEWGYQDCVIRALLK